MASSFIQRQTSYKTISITGSSGGAGNVQMASVPNNAVVVDVSTDTGRGYVLIPFKSSGSWYVKVLTWDSWERVLNTNITFTAHYY